MNNMNTPVAITEGIKISVETEYRSDYSDPLNSNYLFSYRISIENQSDCTVQLLKRQWDIFDSGEGYREVKGEGVVGQQPILAPGEVHVYESACPLKSEVGKMSGTYLMERKDTLEQFLVTIPSFELIAPLRLN